MKKESIFAFLIPLLLLTSCNQAAQSTTLSTPTAEVIPTSTRKLAPTATITQTPLPEFNICSLENFRDCEITEAELLYGDYFFWLKEAFAPSLVTEFQERYQDGIMRIEFPATLYSLNNSSYLGFAPDVSFGDEATRFFMRHIATAYVEASWITKKMKDSGFKPTGYLVNPVFMYEVTNEETGEGIVHPVVLISLINVESSENSFQRYFDKARTMNEPIFIVDYINPAGFDDPLVRRAFENFDRTGRKMENRFEDFSNGNFGSLSAPGLILLTETLDISWLKD